MSQTARLRGAAAAAALVIALAAAGCGGDPYLDALEERARWTVTLTSWVGDESGYRLTTRLVGPPNSALDTLTVAIDLLDAEGGRLERVWHTYDLAEVPRGGPKDVSLRVPAPAGGQTVEGISVSLVLDPTAGEREMIEELRGLAPAGG